MTRFVKHLDALFATAQLSSSFELRWLPPCELTPEEITQQTVLDASWVDDLVLLIQATSAPALVAKVQCAISLVYDAAVQFGLALNMAKDKTSVVLALHGPDAQHTWTQLLNENPSSPVIPFQCRALSQPTAIAIVPDYVYLGSLHDHSGTPAADLKRKLLSIQHLRKILRKGVFKNPKVPMRTRSMIFQSLVMSRLQYNIGAWQSLHMHTARSWQTQIVTLHSQLHPSLARGPGVHSLDVVAGARQVHPMLIIATNRLRLFDRVTQSQMSPLLAILQAQDPEEGRLAMFTQDVLRVLQYVARPEVERLALDANHPQLAQYSFHNPRAFSKLANQCNTRYLKYLDIWVAVRQFAKDFDRETALHGITWQQTDPPTRPVGSFECQSCNAHFASYKALCTHVYKVHQVVNVAHRFAWGSRCRACLKQYHSNEQLIHHLKYYHTGCLIKLILSVQPMDDDQLQDNMQTHRAHRHEQRKQQRMQQHKQPAQRASGPIRPWPWETVQALMRQDTRDAPQIDPELVSEWSQEVLDTLEDTQVASTLQVMCQLPYHAVFARRLQKDLSALHAAMQIPPSPFHGEKQLVFQEALALWQDTNGVPPTRHAAAVDLDSAQTTLRQVRIQQNATLECSTVPQRRAQLQDHLWNELTVPCQIQQQLASVRTRSYQWTIPAPVQPTTTPVFLYVYSGRRREGDFQQFAEHYIQQFQIRAHVLLIDLALNERHDATDETLVSTLLSWMRQGAVAGLLVAPPCETWSEARNMACPDGPAPRPLRTEAQPFGVLQLTISELDQVLISTQLLFTAIRLLICAMITGVPGIMEHPREPRKADRASIWKLPWILQMFNSGTLRKHLVWQARFGAKSAKPTHLAVCHISEFSNVLHSHAVQVNWSSLEVLQGRQGDGSWKTSVAKEYPPLLNRALAHVLTVAHRDRVAASDRVSLDPPNFEKVFWELFSGDVDMAKQVMQPDYAKVARTGRDQQMVLWPNAVPDIYQVEPWSCTIILTSSVFSSQFISLTVHLNSSKSFTPLAGLALWQR